MYLGNGIPNLVERLSNVKRKRKSMGCCKQGRLKGVLIFPGLIKEVQNNRPLFSPFSAKTDT